MERKRKRDLKGLAYVILEAEKSQVLQSANWRCGQPVVQFHSEPKGMRSRKANGVSSSLSQSAKAGEDGYPSSKTGRESSFLLRLFALFKPSALLSLQIQILFSSRNTLTDTHSNV